ncbi:hypothetical protein LPJ78_004474 [Coemansia sp. RSA 989]|nr:hypothetical protein LPJ78_004474 [Coemansia sp. RSA 989]KAJ1870649.1 hypothetical protein LPJ55_004496 [Coemansia sp. RSA 990]
MEFPLNRPPAPLPQVLYATGHEWAVFLAPSAPKGQHMPNEPYYYERNNGITTWIRPFDFIEPPDPQAALQIGLQWKREKEEQKRQAARTRAKKDRPVRQQHIEGTVWRRVETSQKRVFYYNNETKESRWDKPLELADKNQSRPDDTGEGTELNVDDAEWMLAQMQETSDEDEPNAQDTETQETSQEDERLSKLDKPQKIALFKSMLYEAQVNPFGMWDTELSKFANDWRLAAVTDKDEQQDLFDSVCRELIQQRNQQKQLAKPPTTPTANAEHPFDQLLREKVAKKISFAKFCQRNLKDPRYLSIKTSREREKRFNRHMESLQTPK